MSIQQQARPVVFVKVEMSIADSISTLDLAVASAAAWYLGPENFTGEQTHIISWLALTSVEPHAYCLEYIPVDLDAKFGLTQSHLPTGS